jgi:hypothetical protein
MNTTSNASLVNYLVDETAGVTNYTLALCETRDVYTGNLGGIDGATSICTTQCGIGYKFARESELANFNASAAAVNTYWIDRANNATTNCQNWTDGTTNFNGASVIFATNYLRQNTNGLYIPDPSLNSSSATFNAATNIISSTQKPCNVFQQVLCVRGIR